jgi:hypothetical protein
MQPEIGHLQKDKVCTVIAKSSPISTALLPALVGVILMSEMKELCRVHPFPIEQHQVYHYAVLCRHTTIPLRIQNQKHSSD